MNTPHPSGHDRRVPSARAALRLAPENPQAHENPQAPDTASRVPGGNIRHLSVPDEPLLDIRALAEWFSVSESTVRKWTARGPSSGLVPPFIRINGQIRFRPADVRTFLVAREVT